MMEILNSFGEKIDFAYHEGCREGVLAVLAHGVTGDKDRELMKTLAEGLAAKGISALRFSFAGNGESEGEFREATITKEVGDLKAVLDAYAGGKKLISIGYSMGGAVGTLNAVGDDRVSGLVSLAGMVHTKAFYDREFSDEDPATGCMWEDKSKPLSTGFKEDLYQIDHLLEVAPKIQVPWLLIHGKDDDVVLLEDSETVFEVIQSEKKLIQIPGADHSFVGHWDFLVEEITTWVDRHF